MAESAVSLIPVRASDLAIGKAASKAIFDWHGKLLLAQGVVIESQTQLQGLLDYGFVMDAGLEGDMQISAPDSASKSNSHAVAPSSGNAALSPSKETVIALDDVRWHVGETIYLQAIDNASIRYAVRLIGYIKGKTILVTAPAVDGKFEFIRDGQVFVVRAFSGKKAYAFTASAVKSVHSPHPYLHLSYPREVRCTVVRKGARANVKIIASVSFDSPERMSGSTLIDLSTGGTSAIAKSELAAVGESARVKFKVEAAGQDEFLNLQAVLRSISPSDHGDGYKHGFEFQNLTIHDRLILSAFVHQTLAEGS